MIKFLIIVVTIVGLIVYSPYAYRDYTIWDASNPEDDTSTINQVLNSFTTKTTIYDVSQSVDFNLGTPIVDVRSEEEYDKGHIPGSVSVPEPELYEEFPKKFSDINIKVFVYGENEYQAGVATRLLRSMGYTAYSMPEGISGWEKAGLQIQRRNTMYF